MTTVLIAEDEARIVRFLERGLQAAGYTTHSVSDGATALDLALSGAFDLLLLDLGLPSRDGFAVLTELRARRSRLPVVVLTARNEPEDIVAGLDGGADDYVTKPFRLGELLARIRLRLREDRARETFVLRRGDLSLDLRSRRASVAGRTVELTTREFDLLVLLMRHPDQVLSREQILNDVWGFGHDPESNVVDVYIRYLRGKIGAERIATVRGAGYRLV